ncbi:UNVERIFIED_ORG: AraC family transcriptional regulator [Martelella mediterranea]
MKHFPRMEIDIEGFSVVGSRHHRFGGDLVADLWDVDCSAMAGGYYVSRDPRIFVLLETRSGPQGAFTMSEIGGRKLPDCGVRALHFIPAGMEMQTELTAVQGLRHLDLHFDAGTLSRRLGSRFDTAALSKPRFMLNDERLIQIAGLLAAELAAENPLHDLYGDGLINALLVGLLGVPPDEPRPRSKLADWQVRQVTGHIAAHSARRIPLEELAGLIGLSASYFSHAFKASTGLSPQQWQMNHRIERIKDELRNPTIPITTIAVQAGFADTAHFSRSFRRVTGMTPSRWRAANGVAPAAAT